MGCPQCGRSTPEGVRFCPECGYDLPLLRLEPVLTPPDGVPRMDTDAGNQFRTQVAMQAVDLADTFAALFAAPFPDWGAEIAVPAGMSTGGGKQALQHIGLISPGGGTLVIGTVDRVADRAELRAYRRVDEMHRERFGFRFPISITDYDGFTTRLARFLENQEIQVTFQSKAARASSAPDEAPGRSVALWIVMGLLLLAVAGAGVTFWLTRTPAPPPYPVWGVGVPAVPALPVMPVMPAPAPAIPWPVPPAPPAPPR